MVQQIVDENGTLRHIILSALNSNGSNPPTAALLPQQQSFPYGSCCCCCYCSGTSTPVLPPAACVPPVVANVHGNMLAFPGPQNRRRTPNRSAYSSSYSKRSATTTSTLPFQANQVSSTKSPNRTGRASLANFSNLQGLHVESVSKMIIPNSNLDSDQMTNNDKSHSTSHSELKSNKTNVSETITKNSSPHSTLQFNCKAFQPKSSESNLDTCPRSLSLSVSPTSMDSSAGYSSDKQYIDDRDYRSNESSRLPNGSCHSRTSSSSPVDGVSDILEKLSNDLILPDSLNKIHSDSSDVMSTDTDLSTLEVSIGSFVENDSRAESELSMDIATSAPSALKDELDSESHPAFQSNNDETRPESSQTIDMKLDPERSPKINKLAAGVERVKHAVESKNEQIHHHPARAAMQQATNDASHEVQARKKSPTNQKTAFNLGAFEANVSDKCKPNGGLSVCEKITNSADSLTAPKSTKQVNCMNVFEERVPTIVCTKEGRRNVDRKSDHRPTSRKSDKKQKSFECRTSSSGSRTSSEENKSASTGEQPDDQIATNCEMSSRQLDSKESSKTMDKSTLPLSASNVNKPSPQRSPKHLLPQVQCFNLTYTALTATSVKLKWTLLSKESAESSPARSDSQNSANALAQQYLVDMTYNQERTESGKGSPVSCTRIVYQGTTNTRHVSHLNCQSQYSFRVRSVVDERVLVSNLLTITTPEQAQVNKHKKSKQQAMQQWQHQQQLHQQQLHMSQQASHSLEQSVGARGSCGSNDGDPAEKSDQRCAIMILVLFSLFAVAMAIMMQIMLTSDGVGA